MTEETNKIQVNLKYNGIEKTLEGSAQSTWLMLNKIYNAFIPTYEIAEKLLLNADIEKLAKDCEDIIAFSPEGACILIPKGKLTDNETIALWLLANYLGKQLNLTTYDSLSKEELQTKLCKSGKITSTRVGELVKNEWVTKTEDNKFRMTTFGVSQMQKEILPRIISKIGIS